MPLGDSRGSRERLIFFFGGYRRVVFIACVLLQTGRPRGIPVSHRRAFGQGPAVGLLWAAGPFACWVNGVDDGQGIMTVRKVI